MRCEMRVGTAEFKSKCEWMRRKPGVASVEYTKTNQSSELPPAYPQEHSRFEIHKHLGIAVVEIAENLGVNFSTLYREIRRHRQRYGGKTPLPPRNRL